MLFTSATIIAHATRGEKPVDLPVQQSTKFRLLVNLNPRPHGATHPTCPRGQGHRLEMLFAAVHESASGPKQTWSVALRMSAFGGKADIDVKDRHFRF
jgi:hypothetical protein